MTTGSEGGGSGDGNKVDDAWDDGPDDGGPDSGPDDGPESGPDTSGVAGAPGEPGRKKRRRRRRRGGGGERTDQPAGSQPAQRPEGAPEAPATSEASAVPAPQQDRGGTDNRGNRGGDRGQRDNRGDRGGRGGDNRGGQRADNRGGGADNRSGADNRGGQRADNRGGGADNRGGQRADNRGDNRGGQRADNRGGDNRGGQRADNRGGGDNRSGQRGDDHRSDRSGAGSGGDSAPSADDRSAPREARTSQPPFEPIGVRGGDTSYEEDEPAQPAEAWGTDDGSPAPAIALTSAFPADAPADDLDPVTFPLVDGHSASLGDDIASLVGVRFVPAGRITWCDASDGDFTPGERVMVDAERGPRLAWIATVPMRKATRDRGVRRVIRRANESDLRGEREGDAGQMQALRTAKDKAAALRLPLKVFRVETGGGKLNVYYTTDDRLDLRDFVRDVSQATGLRIELRQLGVRDEAKVVGGIGSCGLTLCCTTWLPDFVPVSIKMAKDQGLVLSPTKVAGQCGRLKCCLVYEQATYAEMRKGLPKLGKRVVGARGEGRVVEVDVMRQRVRVSYGPGDTEVVLATEVKPLFPPGTQPAGGGAGRDGGPRDGRDGGPRDGRGGPGGGRDSGPGGRDGGRRDGRDRDRGRGGRDADPRPDAGIPGGVDDGPVTPGLSRDAFAARLAALNDPGAQVEPDDTEDVDARDNELTAGEKQAARAHDDAPDMPDLPDDGFGDLPDEDPSRDPSRGDDDPSRDPSRDD